MIDISGRPGRLFLAVCTACALAGCGGSAEEPSPPPAPQSSEGASVSFGSPADGATVPSPVKVTMLAEGLTIEPAGTPRDGAGHFHVMVDTDCVPPGQTIPSDDTHKHYGQAQTETEITLAPGQHTLCLQAGDGAHIALDLTDTVTFTVQ